MKEGLSFYAPLFTKAEMEFLASRCPVGHSFHEALVPSWAVPPSPTLDDVLYYYGNVPRHVFARNSDHGSTIDEAIRRAVVSNYSAAKGSGLADEGDTLFETVPTPGYRQRNYHWISTYVKDQMVHKALLHDSSQLRNILLLTRPGAELEVTVLKALLDFKRECLTIPSGPTAPSPGFAFLPSPVAGAVSNTFFEPWKLRALPKNGDRYTPAPFGAQNTAHLEPGTLYLPLEQMSFPMTDFIAFAPGIKKQPAEFIFFQTTKAEGRRQSASALITLFANIQSRMQLGGVKIRQFCPGGTPEMVLEDGTSVSVTLKVIFVVNDSDFDRFGYQECLPTAPTAAQVEVDAKTLWDHHVVQYKWKPPLFQP